MISSVRVIGARVVRNRLVTRPEAIRRGVHGVVRTYTQLMTTRIKANASGRPGPNAPTGDYRASWSFEIERDGDTTTGTAFTNLPQGRRLEHGFVGPDSLGRVYNQPPFPHVGPARDQIAPQFVGAMQKLVRGAT